MILKELSTWKFKSQKMMVEGGTDISPSSSRPIVRNWCLIVESCWSEALKIRKSSILIDMLRRAMDGVSFTDSIITCLVHSLARIGEADFPCPIPMEERNEVSLSCMKLFVIANWAMFFSSPLENLVEEGWRGVELLAHLAVPELREMWINSFCS